MEIKKSSEYLLETLFLGGLDGTRTRDPMRDRHVFKPAELPDQNIFKKGGSDGTRTRDPMRDRHVF